MDGPSDTFQAGPPTPPPGAPTDRLRLTLAWLAGLVATLLVVLIVVLLAQDEGTGAATEDFVH